MPISFPYELAQRAEPAIPVILSNSNKSIRISVIFFSIKTVFSRPWYFFLAFVTAVLLLLLAIWLPNLTFLRHIADSDTYDLSAKLGIFWSSLGFLKTNFTALTRTLIIVVVILSGINVALLVYYLKNRIKLEKTAGTGLLGTIAGLVGVGCASCGSVILSSFIGLSASTAFTGALPLRGAEFGLFGILILLISIYLITRKIQNPLVCKI